MLQESEGGHVGRIGGNLNWQGSGKVVRDGEAKRDEAELCWVQMNYRVLSMF